MNTSLTIKTVALGCALVLASQLNAASPAYGTTPQPTLSTQVSSYTGDILKYSAQATALGALGYSAYHGLRTLGYAIKSFTECNNTDEIEQNRNTSLAKTFLGLCVAGTAHATTKIQWTGLLLKLDLGVLVGGLLNYLAKK